MGDFLDFLVAKEESDRLGLLNAGVGEREWLKRQWRRRKGEEEDIFSTEGKRGTRF